MDQPLTIRARLWGTLAAFLLLYAAGPGILAPGGLGLLAPLAIALWAAVASRPGRAAFWIDALGAGVGWTLILSWAGHVWWGLLLGIGPGMGLYMAAQNVALRRLAGRLPLAAAAPAAWLLGETVRAALEPPFGFQWMRLGTFFHDQTWINGSARVWGLAGLGLVIASLGGLLADLWHHARGQRRVGPAALACGLAGPVLGVLLAALVPAPATVDGPVLMLVQPGIPQERKMSSGDPRALFDFGAELTARALEQRSARGEPAPDLVAWGETMLHTPVIDPALADALDAGVRTDPWAFGGRSLEREHATLWSQLQRNWVDVTLFGSTDGRLDGVLPKGTAFVCGAEYFTPVDGRVRRMNAVFLWERPGQPEGPRGKLHLVPTGETMLGLERVGLVRDFIMWMAGYVPDLLPDDSPERTLSFRARDGRRYSLGVSICFDNAFDDPYSRPVRGAGADFHLVVSNEAWFKQSQEADQMMAFSRLQAIATGRTVVRATNSGISAILAPDGRELARLVVDGRDREVEGVLTDVVPVPSKAGLTPWVRWGRAWSWLWILGPAALLLAVRKRGGNRPRAEG